jgi:predicted PurR-regulated permease PerM
MNKDLNLSLKSLKLSSLKTLLAKYSRHTVFAAIMIVLLVYLLVVYKINSLANAEPSADQQQTISTSVPHIDSQAINQIQMLENNNANVHSLFEQARNNPFSE